jgi:hypothetical protein
LPLLRALPSITLPHPIGVEPNRRPTPFISPSSNGHPLASSPITVTLMKRCRPFPSPHRLPSPLSPLRPYKRCHHLGHFPRNVLPQLSPLIRAPSHQTPSTDAMIPFLSAAGATSPPRRPILASVSPALSPSPFPRRRGELWSCVAPLGELWSSSVPSVEKFTPRPLCFVQITT